MRKTTKFMLLLVLFLGLVAVAGCGNQDAGSGSEGEGQALAGLTAENPIKVDQEVGTLTYLAKVNGKYLYEPTRHASVFKGGSNGDKSIFTGLVDVEPFYNGLIEIGAVAGENMTLENKETTKVEGDVLAVTVTWEGAGKEYTLDEVITDNNNTPIEIRFGGNLQTALDKKTGCLICLDSCPVGITSNAAYTYGAVEGRSEVEFTGNKDLLPADGSLVTVTLKVSK